MDADEYCVMFCIKYFFVYFSFEKVKNANEMELPISPITITAET